MTNKLQTFYPTQVQSSPDRQTSHARNHKFQKQLNQQINQTIIFKKHQIVKKSKEFLENIERISVQAQRYRNKIYQQEKQFQDNIEKHIKYDIRKWKDYDQYFKNYFRQIQSNLHFHKKQNEEYKRKIQEKEKSLKIMLKAEMNAIVLQPLAQDSRKHTITTKESTINLSYSHSLRHRVKTQSSLPSLKPFKNTQRFKTIQTETDLDQNQLRKQRKAYSYMESIGAVKQKQKSLFPMLINMLKWYKTSQIDIQNDWFAKIILKPRHYNKLIQYLERKSITRKILRKK